MASVLLSNASLLVFSLASTIRTSWLTPASSLILIELRNDLIATADAQRDWGLRLAPLLQAALTDVDPV